MCNTLMIPACPKCKTNDDVFINIRAYGWVKEFFDKDTGLHSEIDIDNLMYSNSNTIRCCFCKEIRYDLILWMER